MTPTKNESLPELPAKWRARADAISVSGTWNGDFVAGFIRDCADDLQAALTREAPTEDMSERCEKCGRLAVHYLVMDNIQNARRMPFCNRCTDEHEHTAQEVNDHEMRHFGGAYGLVTYHYEPLEAATPPAPQRMAQGEEITDPSNDREALLYLMQQFDGETWNCERCGHSEDTATMDSAHFLREYLAEHPAQPPHQDRGGEASKFMHEMLIDWRAAASIGRPLTDAEISEFEQRMIAALTEAKQQGPGEAVASYWPDDRVKLMLHEAIAAGARHETALSLVNQAIKESVARRQVEVCGAPQVEAKRQTGEGAADEVISSVVRAIQKARNVADGAAACHAQGAQHQAGMRRACNIIEEAISAISSEARP